LTFIAMQSMPTVSSRSACSATTSFEPTPSVDSAMPSVSVDAQHRARSGAAAARPADGRPARSA
jgi:hypothetical protein